MKFNFTVLIGISIIVLYVIFISYDNIRYLFFSTPPIGDIYKQEIVWLDKSTNSFDINFTVKNKKSYVVMIRMLYKNTEKYSKREARKDRKMSYQAYLFDKNKEQIHFKENKSMPLIYLNKNSYSYKLISHIILNKGKYSGKIIIKGLDIRDSYMQELVVHAIHIK
ncbi:MAG: hypothetical protein OCD00_12640 [Colwellia sp.]